MKFSLGRIKRHTDNDPFAFEDQADVSELETMNNDIRKIDPVHVYGTAVVQDDDIMFTLTIAGTMVLPCARTLVDVPYSFNINTVEIFSESPYEEDSREDDIHPIAGEVLDLTPLIKENILLEVPYRVFSEDADQALFAGDGWELMPEEAEQEPEPDPRLKKLASLLDNQENKE